MTVRRYPCQSSCRPYPCRCRSCRWPPRWPARRGGEEREACRRRRHAPGTARGASTHLITHDAVLPPSTPPALHPRTVTLPPAPLPPAPSHPHPPTSSLPPPSRLHPSHLHPAQASTHLITDKAERDRLGSRHARRDDLGQALVGDLAGGLVLGHDIRVRQVVRRLVVLDLVDLLVDIDRAHVIVLVLFLRHAASDRRLGLGLELVWSARREQRLELARGSCRFDRCCAFAHIMVGAESRRGGGVLSLEGVSNNDFLAGRAGTTRSSSPRYEQDSH